MIKNKQATRLQSFLKGFRSAFDLTGRTYIQVPDLSNGWIKDGEAIRGDWDRIGNDMRKAMGQVSREE